MTSPKICISNLKKNWLLPILGFAFLCLESTKTMVGLFGAILGFVFMIVVATQISDLWEQMSKCDIGTKVFSLLSAIGICWYGFDRSWLPFSVALVGAISGVLFVYVFVLLLLDAVVTTWKKTKVFHGIHRAEGIVYALLTLAMVGLCVYAFSQSQAFYATSHTYDVVYTSDSPSLVKDNAYLWLFHSENDFRQPLFMVFSAPFLGISYLISKVASQVWWMSSLLLNVIQIIMMMFSNFLIAKMMKINSLKRVCFMVFSTCTYTTLLFGLMMEQYILAYFWIIFLIYQYTEEKKASNFALMGATGTLLTGAVLAPLTTNTSPIKHPLKWLKEMILAGICFLLIMFGAGRLDVVYHLPYRMELLSGYTGKIITMQDKVLQYLSFISNCLIAPQGYIDFEIKEYATWKLRPVTGVCWVGVVLLVLMFISFVIHRKNKLTQIAGAWTAYSFVVLGILGWGTTENGLILYALYFGWAFFVLLFQLLETIGDKLKIKFLIPLVTIVCVGYLGMVNVTAIKELVSFAIQYYPV